MKLWAAVGIIFGVMSITGEKAHAQGFGTFVGFGNFVLDGMTQQSDPTVTILLQNRVLLEGIARNVVDAERDLIRIYQEIGASEDRINRHITNAFNTNDVKDLLAETESYFVEVETIAAEMADPTTSTVRKVELQERMVSISEETAQNISRLRSKSSLGSYLSSPIIAATARVELLARQRAGQPLGPALSDITEYFKRALDSSIEGSVASELELISAQRSASISTMAATLGATAVTEGFFGKDCVAYASHQLWSSSFPRGASSNSTFHIGYQVFIVPRTADGRLIEFYRLPSYPTIRVQDVPGDSSKAVCASGVNARWQTRTPIANLPAIRNYPVLLGQAAKANTESEALHAILELHAQTYALGALFENGGEAALSMEVREDARNELEHYLAVNRLIDSAWRSGSRQELNLMIMEYQSSYDKLQRDISETEGQIALALANAQPDSDLASIRTLLSYLVFAQEFSELVDLVELPEQSSGILDGTTTPEPDAIDGETSSGNEETIALTETSFTTTLKPFKEIEALLEEYDALGDPSVPSGSAWTAHEVLLNEIFLQVRGVSRYPGDTTMSDLSRPPLSADDVFRPSLAKSVGVFFGILFATPSADAPMYASEGQWAEEASFLNGEIATRAEVLLKNRDPNGDVSQQLRDWRQNIDYSKCWTEPCWQTQ